MANAFAANHDDRESGAGIRELALFAGAGGGIMGGILLGWRTVCAVELDPYCRSILLARQRDGVLNRFPIWDDIRTFSGRPWDGSVDVISGGFPCQDISPAGKRAGIDGERSGLWLEMARIVREVRPRYVFVENSAALIVRGLNRVLGDLAAMGFDARWGVLGACCVGAPHSRERTWIVANATGLGRRQRDKTAQQGESWRKTLIARHAAHSQKFGGRTRRYAHVGNEAQQPMSFGADTCRHHAPDSYDNRERELSLNAQMGCAPSPQRLDESHLTNADSAPLRQQSRRLERQSRQGQAIAGVDDWWPVDLLSGVDDGLAHRVDRVVATGNGQIPAVARLAWMALTNAQGDEPGKGG